MNLINVEGDRDAAQRCLLHVHVAGGGTSTSKHSADCPVSAALVNVNDNTTCFNNINRVRDELKRIGFSFGSIAPDCTYSITS